jgi:hypothetical protein
MQTYELKNLGLFPYIIDQFALCSACHTSALIILELSLSNYLLKK